MTMQGVSVWRFVLGVIATGIIAWMLARAVGEVMAGRPTVPGR